MDISKIKLQDSTYNIKDSVARNSIDTINETLNNLQKTKKYIFMGDSYGDGYSPDGNTTSWITLLVNKLNLTSSQYISVHQGGYRFAYSSSDYNFINLLNNLESDSNLTDMYVCAGYNDAPYTENDIIIGIQTFNTLFNTKFPNAKLHIGFIGWSSNGQTIRQLSSSFIAYKKACDSLNIECLNGCEFALHNYFKYFASDGIHPNQNGQNSIANAIYNCITTGYANVTESEGFYFTLVSGSTNNTNTRMILNNGMVTAEMNGSSNNNMSLNFAEAISQTGNVPVKIADITNSLAVGTDYNTCLFQGVPCVVQASDNSYSTKILDFIIKNKELYVVGAGASGGSYQAISLKSIQIPACSFTISALKC